MKVLHLAQVAFVGAAAVAVYSFVATARDGELRRACASLCQLRPTYAARNRRAPDFELPDLEGRRVKLSDYRGKVVILNFWTKHCGPCLDEMPALGTLAQHLADRSDIVVLSVSTDESAADVRETLTAAMGPNVSFRTLVDPDGVVVGGRFGTKLYPETWFIDPRGIIRARFDGPRDWESPLVLDFAAGLRSAPSCDLAFEQGEPDAAGAAFCEDV